MTNIDIQHHCYGACCDLNVQDTPDDMPDIERGAFRGEASAASREKAIAMRPLADQDADTESTQSEASDESAQAGVKRLKAIAATWSRTGLTAAYLGIVLLAFATSLESQTTNNLTVFATSAFSSHSLVSTVGVVQGVVLSVAKPPLSKAADVFGRLEAFTLSIFLLIIGYIQQAASDSVETYSAAQIFYAAGATGLQILIQIFVADTSDLLNRALVSTIADVPFLVNVWIGPALAQHVLRNLNWRWGYGIWAIVLPIAYLPVACALGLNQRKAAKLGLLPKSQFKGLTLRQSMIKLYYELDVVGLLLICGAFSLILIPLSLAANGGWENGNITAMLLVGGLCLIAFPFWERNTKLAPHAFFPRHMFTNRTSIAGLALAFFYFMAFYLSVLPYFQSYLLVVQGESVQSAGRIVQTFTFTSTISTITVSFLIKRVKRYKFFVVTGTIVYTAGFCLMIFYRTAESSNFMIIATQVFIGVGGGMTHGPAQLGVQASNPQANVASATTLFLTFLEIGGAVGNAISGFIWSRSVPKKLVLYLPDETKDQADAIFGNVTLAATGWPMGSPTRDAISQAYQETMTRILTVAVCVSIPCILLSLLMENYDLGKMAHALKGTIIGRGEEGSNRRDSVSEPLTARDTSHVYEDDDQEPELGDSEETTALVGRPRKNS